MSSKNKIENKAAKQILSRVRERKKRDLGVAVRVTVVEPDAQPVGVEGVLLSGPQSAAFQCHSHVQQARGAGRGRGADLHKEMEGVGSRSEAVLTLLHCKGPTKLVDG